LVKRHQQIGVNSHSLVLNAGARTHGEVTPAGMEARAQADKTIPYS